MKKMLLISAYVPYSTVPHAGGKTHYYYLKQFSKEFDIKLITFSFLDESKKAAADLDGLNIDYTIIERKYTAREKILNLESTFNPFNRNCRMVSNTDQLDVLAEVKKCKKAGYYPDVILLEWTQMLLACHSIKKFFPKAKVIVSEHDVSFLAYERKYLQASGMQRAVNQIDYKSIYRKEKKYLEQSDLILVHNDKDRALLEKNDIDKNKIQTIVPFFSMLKSKPNRKISKNLLFFGDMSRKENYLSAIWFIENVLDKLDGFTFIILGNKPDEELKKYVSDRVIVTGFVDDIQPYFDDALCFVSPLIRGGGIKVKVLEAFTAGLPVLTNSVGIEGIPAVNNKDYIHCETPDEYCQSICSLYNDLSLVEYLGENGSAMIAYYFNREQSSKDVITRINKMLI